MTVMDSGVVVVAHREREMHVYLELPGGHRQAVQECLVCFVVGAHEHLAMCAATGEEVASAGDNGARLRHALGVERKHPRVA
jgi:hypothetical protein